MDSIFGNLTNALAEIWKNIGVAQKTSIILIALVAIGATSLIMYMGSRPNWQILYSGLDRKTAAQVYDIVKDENVDVKLSNSGTTIMVPQEYVNELRLKVVGEGVPVNKTGVGWELFDNMKLGATEQQQKMTFQRAIQGELQRMIKEIPGIISCKVILPQAKKKVFRREQHVPKANVLVVLASGYRLKNSQVDGIRNMVSSSVEGMSPDNVSVVDNRGQSLAKAAQNQGGSGVLSDRQCELQSQMESQLKEKAEAILRPIVGADKVVAMVSCEMDFDEVDRLTETYNAEQTVVISEKVVDEDNSKIGKTPSGKVGAEANIVSVAEPNKASAQAQSQQQDKRKTTDRNYVVPKTVEKVKIKGGTIKNISVSVTVDQKPGPDGGEWGKLKTDEFEALVKAAVGASNYGKDADGKDRAIVTVKEMVFAKEEPEAVPAASLLETLSFNVDQLTSSPMVRPIVGIVFLVVLFNVFRKYFKKSEVEGAEMDNIYGENIQAINSEEDRAREALENSPVDPMQRKAIEAAPESVAQAMENWLKADSSF